MATLPKMDETLRAIFLDAYQYLQARQVPVNSEEFWKTAAEDMAIAGNKWNNHPLAYELFPAVYSYLSRECKRKMEETKHG